jgi:hypothetical protein
MTVPDKVAAADWSMPLEFGPPDRSPGKVTPIVKTTDRQS